MRDIALENHRAWLGLLQPVGLVVSPNALVRAQAQVDQNIGDLAVRLKSLLVETKEGGWILPVDQLPALFIDLLDWRPSDLQKVDAEDPSPSIYLADYQETIAANFVVKAQTTDPSPLLYIYVHSSQIDFDTISNDAQGWQASAQAKFERLLREKDVSIGLLVGESALRIIYAPKGESAGHITFPYQLMQEVAGRIVLSAFKMLFGAQRLFSAPTKERLPALLAESRQYQNEVSTKLAEQVLAALYEMIRGFQAADERIQGNLLNTVLAENPNEVYHAGITVLMRMVFVLFAEDRGLIPSAEIYIRNYSLKGLFERLREDEPRYQDSMDQRYGAWSQMLVLFRLLYDGVETPHFSLPARHGHLFDPNRFHFLEGRKARNDKVAPPLIADGVIYRVLSKLILLDGERISYRALDVEQIGSVYETVMGFQLEISKGLSVAIKPKKTHGAPVHINLKELLAKHGSDRKKYFKAITDQEIAGEAVTNAKTLEQLEAALERKISRIATPHAVPKGSLILQPSDARRRSGSHYTPRSLTAPIVERTLEPVISGLGDNPLPEQILEIKVCDPAMGSGAFLVEASRQLSELLVTSWHRHKRKPNIPPDEDELLHARRLIVQRCIYGVDKNPMAVNLAKLSLWLATFAKDHPFTFLDHALKAGDSLVGLKLEQIANLTWDSRTLGSGQNAAIKEMVQDYLSLRDKIRNATESSTYDSLTQLNDKADGLVSNIRHLADLIVAAWFSAGNDRGRRSKLQEIEIIAANILAAECRIRSANSLPNGLTSFHWQLEYPEVFQRENPGFDIIVGNPPFAGKNNLAESNVEGYPKWLQITHPESHGNSDIVAHFFRRAFNLIRSNGALGLIATNTIGQGDTRSTGLRWICNHEGQIYDAIRRKKWPGQASVIVSIVHIFKGSIEQKKSLDGREVEKITAFLFHDGGHEDPHRLYANTNKSFQGSVVLGMGFTFDDTDTSGEANTLKKMKDLIKKDRKNAKRIFPYIGGEEVNNSPTHTHHRYAINFGSMSESEARKWPDLISILEKKVKGCRGSHSTAEWWQFERVRDELYNAIGKLPRILAINCGATPHAAFTFLPPNMVFANTLAIISLSDWASFAIVQSRIHEIWARFFSSSMKDDLRYTPTDCFETFPFPENYEINKKLESAGKEYYEFRAAVMVKNSEGLTKTYNRFHDPDESSPEIIKLRELHKQIDEAVLDAYGWEIIKPVSEFLLDHDDEDDNSEHVRSRRKKPWRYRWPENIRNDILARLIELNIKRAEAESLRRAS
ncbi:Eco57I restriction-modification methylase domain-containing protein [Oligoflexus tunisiensis]|uniref:Eco57I restriction-modification methylase domain-containing protein n=1 Tax=Oligoflexus tunisiensis TaxID=708132 RepID=UPI000A46D5CA|nr:DNA methyltransferase [Oligoflexus tunisiensis]